MASPNGSSEDCTPGSGLLGSGLVAPGEGDARPVRFSVEDDQVKVEGANVVAVDLDATNGVIHVIDAVIMPPAKARQMGMAAPSCSDSTPGA